MQSEAVLHQHIAQFIKMQYPGLHFRTDFAAGNKMTMGQAARHKRLQSGKSWPDLFIAKPVGNYHGLFIELKREGTTIKLKNGDLTKNKHIREQLKLIRHLCDLGYFACMSVGFDNTVEVINTYLRGEY